MRHIVIPGGDSRELPFYLAAEEWIAKNLPAAEYFFTWIVDPTVIVGRHQCIAAEVDIDFCRQRGIDVCRRKSGGGCVYADRQNMMMSYICPSTDVVSTFASYTDRVAAMLRSLGLDAHASGRNDVLIGERKVSGGAFYHLPGRSIAHGTMLYKVDSATMCRAITPSSAKLATHAVQSVESRVTSISEHLPKLSLGDLRAHAISYLTDSEITLTEADMKDIEQIAAEYRSPQWLRDPARTSATVTRKYLMDGSHEITLHITLSGGNITDITYEGDLLAPPDLSALIGKPYGPDIELPRLQ